MKMSVVRVKTARTWPPSSNPVKNRVTAEEGGGSFGGTYRSGVPVDSSQGVPPEPSETRHHCEGTQSASVVLCK